jgi:hypothetical protein
MNGLETELTRSAKSPLAPLYKRGVIPLFSEGRPGGIQKGCWDNSETINNSFLEITIPFKVFLQLYNFSV